MSENTEYVWKFDLEEYAMTKDVAEDYTAKVSTIQSKDIEAIAKAIAAERTEYRESTIVNIAQLIDEKIRQFVCQGNTVVTGTALYAPAIEGVFIGKTGEVDPKRNRCVVNISPAQAMREELEKVKPVFSGFVKDLGGARIALVTDTSTGLTDGSITPGEILIVTGKKIKCVNADGSGIGKVSFVNTETQAETTVTSLAQNDPSKLMFNAPASLTEGTYTLRIETYFSTATMLLKSVRVLEYSTPLVVGGSEEDPDDGGSPGTV